MPAITKLRTKIFHKLLCLGPLGYEIIRSVKLIKPVNYQQINTLSMYAPWISDKQFSDFFNFIMPYTLNDIYRCHELWSLVEQVKNLQGSIIEVGVWKGGTGAIIAKKAKLCGIKENIYLCDTFTGVVKAGSKDSSYKGEEHEDTSIQEVENLIYDRLNLDNVIILQGIFPDQTSGAVEQEIFRLCHIDVDVYQSAKEITEWVWDKLVIGGIIVYDDYGLTACDGIKKYVEEQKLKSDRLFIYNLNSHALMIKIK